jgi:membrane-associated phospholipid phosphatase
MADDGLAQSNAAAGAKPPAMAGIALLAALSVAITIVAILASGLRFQNAENFVVPFGGMLASLAIINIYQYIRMPDNKRTILFINMIGVYLLMSIAMMTYQYALATANAIPISRWVESADAAIGFNWYLFSMTVHKVPYLSETLAFCYVNWMREFAVLFALLSFYRKFDALYEFTTTYIIAGMITLSFSGPFDSRSYQGASAFSIPSLHHPSGYGPEAIVVTDLLRHGPTPMMDFNHILGLVCFPSFHAGAAVLLAVVSRELKWLWAPFLVFNIMMLIGTITEGGHNLVDVLAGCAISIAAIAVAQALRRSALDAKLAMSVVRLFTWRGAAVASASR